MQKYHGFDKEFYDYLFDYIIVNGGLRQQIIASDLVNQLQKNYDPKHNLNLFRKQYGNIYEALKPIKDPYFILDSLVIKMRKPNQIQALHKAGKLTKQQYQKYLEKQKENQLKQIEILKINHENKCKKCGQTYNVNVNRADSCGGKGPHDAKY